LGANRGSATLGIPAAASNGSVTVTANARLRAEAQSRQIFDPGGHSRPQILHFIDPPVSDRNDGHALDFLADPYDNVTTQRRHQAAPVAPVGRPKQTLCLEGASEQQAS
jgi:hypothetical protein